MTSRLTEWFCQARELAYIALLAFFLILDKLWNGRK